MLTTRPPSGADILSTASTHGSTPTTGADRRLRRVRHKSQSSLYLPTL